MAAEVFMLLVTCVERFAIQQIVSCGQARAENISVFELRLQKKCDYLLTLRHTSTLTYLTEVHLKNAN